MKIQWTDKAKFQVREIHNFYASKVSRNLANKITQAISKKPLLLLTHPQLGQKEPILNEINQNLRYLVEGNYKLIYLQEKTSIIVVSVFDTRQNPLKLKDI